MFTLQFNISRLELAVFQEVRKEHITMPYVPLRPLSRDIH